MISNLNSLIVFLEDLRSLTTPASNDLSPDNRTEYRVLLVYPDGTSRQWDVFRSRDKMEVKLRAVARRPGVRYHCEEWMANPQGIPEFRPVLLAEYDV